MDAATQNSFPTGNTAADMIELSGVSTLSAGSHTIEFRISGSGSAKAAFSADDFFVNLLSPEETEPVPATETLGLLLLGLLVAAMGSAFLTRRSALRKQKV